MPLIGPVAIVERTWDVYVRHMRAFAEPLIWMLIPGILTSILPVLLKNNLGLTAFFTIVLTLISIVISIWATIRIVDIAWTMYEGRALAESLTRSLSWGHAGRLLDFILVSLLAGAIVFASLFLFVIPAIILGVWFAFATLAFLIEGVAPGTACLRRSKELVAGRFWAMLGRWLVLGTIVPILFVLALLGIVYLIALATGDAGRIVTGNFWWVNLITNVGAIIFAGFFTTSKVIFFAEARKKV